MTAPRPLEPAVGLPVLVLQAELSLVVAAVVVAVVVGPAVIVPFYSNLGVTYPLLKTGLVNELTSSNTRSCTDSLNF